MYKINNIKDFHNMPKQEIYEENGIKFYALNAILIARKLVQANDYNPNYVAKDKMKLLEISIKNNGFCFGIVMIFDYEIEKFIIIDGDHRNQISGDKWLKLKYIPAVILNHSINQRLEATVQFNKARGVHKIDGNAELVNRLVQLGISDIEISKTLGMDADELLRLKRNSKIATIYKNLEYSNSWE